MNRIRNVVVWVLSAIYTSCWWSLFVFEIDENPIMIIPTILVYFGSIGLIILIIIWLIEN